MGRKKGDRVEGLDGFEKFLQQRLRAEGTVRQYVSAVNVLKIPLPKLKGMPDDALVATLNDKILEKKRDEGKLVLNRSHCRQPAYIWLLKHLKRPGLADLLVSPPQEPRRVVRMDIPFSTVRGMRDRAKRSDWKVLIMLLSDTGARISAIMGARVRDIGYDGGRAVLSITERKTGVISAKYLSRATTGLLKRYIRGKSPDNFIIPFRSCERARQILRGLQLGVHPHKLRHSKAVGMLRVGFDIMDVAEQLDHRSLESTRKYLKASGISSKKVMEKTEPDWGEQD